MVLAQRQLHELLAPWRQVAEKVDAFFARAQSLSHGQIVCGPGCDRCCQDPDRTVLLVEALALLWGLHSLPPEDRETIQQGASETRGCTLLRGGHCAIYACRPVICRTHGLAMRRADAPTGWASCELNYTGVPPAAEARLNEELLTAGLTVADGLVRRELQIAEASRIPIRELALVGSAALPTEILLPR